MTVSAQTRAMNFMDDHSAIFHAFSRTESVARDGMGAALIASAQLARKLMAAARVDKNSMTAAACRRMASAVVACAWENDTLGTLDDEALISGLARGLARLEEAEHDLWGGAPTTEHDVVAMTMATILQPIAVYDFRQDPAVLLHLLTSRVLSMCKNYVARVSAANGGRGEEDSALLRTAARHLSVMMADAYDREGRRVVSFLDTVAERDIQAALDSIDPVANILKSFDRVSAAFVAAAAFYSNR